MIKTFFKNNLFILIFGIISITGFYIISLYSYVLYHSLIEIFNIVIMFGIAIFTWNSKKFLGNNYLLFAGIAYLFVALISLFHTLAYKGMGVFTNFPGANLATQLWIASRYLMSISLLLGMFFLKKRLNYKLQVLFYLIATTLILLSIFYWKIFPVCYVEGAGLTTFKIVSEYIVTFILLAVIFFLYIYRKEFSKIIFGLLLSSLIASILAELSFTLYTDVYGLFNQLGHFFVLLASFLLYKAIIEIGFSQPFNLLFFKLKQSEKEITESEEKFRSLYFSMSEGVCLHEMIYDESKKPLDYRIIDVNPAYESILGVKKDQVIGRKASEIYGTDNAPYIDVYAQATESGNPESFETYFPPMEKYFSISVFSPSEGKFATIFADITEKKINERKIESLSRFPAENPNPIIRINSNNEIIYTNEPAQTILAQLNDEKKDKLKKLLLEPVSSMGKNNKLKMIEFRIGKLIFEFTLTPVKDFDYFNIYGKDVTIIKRTERLRNSIAKEKALNEERNKLARELHDTVTQTLFSANLIAEIVPNLWEKDPKTAVERLKEVSQLNNAALMEMRTLLYELRPSVLKDEDLGIILRNLARSVEGRTKISIEIIITGDHKYPPKIELGYFRIAQEALNNIIKHSKASKVSITLNALADRLYMEIADNGQGFNDKDISSTSLGLAIMRERAKKMGSVLTIESIPGKGSKITVTYTKDNRKTKS